MLLYVYVCMYICCVIVFTGTLFCHVNSNYSLMSFLFEELQLVFLARWVCQQQAFSVSVYLEISCFLSFEQGLMQNSCLATFFLSFLFSFSFKQFEYVITLPSGFHWSLLEVTSDYSRIPFYMMNHFLLLLSKFSLCFGF